jgi:hypothetical protein
LVANRVFPVPANCAAHYGIYLMEPVCFAVHNRLDMAANTRPHALFLNGLPDGRQPSFSSGNLKSHS